MKKIFKHYHYDSIYEFVEVAMSTPKDKRKSSVNNDEDFAGTETVEDAAEIASNGWDVDEIDAKLDNIKTNEKHEQSLEYGVVGMYPDVPEFLTGNPDNMVTIVDELPDTQYAHIVISLSEAWYIETPQFKNRITAVASVIHNLEVDGYRVKLSLLFANDYKAGRVTCAVTLKEYEQSLGISEIAGAIHQSFLRRLEFLWDEGRSWFNDYGGYGMTLDDKQCIECIKQIWTDEEIFYLPTLTAIHRGDDALYEKAEKFMTDEGAKQYAKYVEDKVRTREITT